MTDSLYAGLPPADQNTEDRAPAFDWIARVLVQSAIPVDDTELPLVAEVYQEYERLIRVLDEYDLPSAESPATTLDASR